MKVSLLHTPPWTTLTPPLNVTYLAASLRDQGYEAEVIDLNAELYAAARPETKENWDPDRLFWWQQDEPYQHHIFPEHIEPHLTRILDRALAGGTDAVGISVLSPCVARTLAAAIRKRRPETLIIAGGQCCDPMWFGEDLNATGLFDAVVYGEGEVTLLELLASYREKRRVEPILGALFWRDGKHVNPGLRPAIEDLDAIPFPDFAGLDMSLYGQNWTAGNPGAKVFSVLSTRGCVRKCDFCMQQTIWGGIFRQRSPQNVADEIELRVKQGAVYVHFNDLLINGNPRALQQMCEELIRRGIRVPMTGSAIITRKLTVPALETMRRAGIQHLDFGLEHTEVKVLHELGKHYGREEIQTTLGNCKAAGMDYSYSIIVGHPAESEADFLRLVAFFVENPDIMTSAPYASLCAVIKGSDLWRKMDYYGITMNGNDAIGWYSKDGLNTLAVRSRRAEIMRHVSDVLWGSPRKLTGKYSDGRLGGSDAQARVLRDLLAQLRLHLEAGFKLLDDQRLGADLDRAVNETMDARIKSFEASVTALREGTAAVVAEHLGSGRMFPDITDADGLVRRMADAGVRELLAILRDAHGGLSAADAELVYTFIQNTDVPWQSRLWALGRRLGPRALESLSRAGSPIPGRVLALTLRAFYERVAEALLRTLAPLERERLRSEARARALAGAQAEALGLVEIVRRLATELGFDPDQLLENLAVPAAGVGGLLPEPQRPDAAEIKTRLVQFHKENARKHRGLRVV